MLEMNQGHLPNNNHVSIRGDHFVLDQGVAIDGHNGEVDLAIDEIADQTPVNYTKLMLLNIVDPNLAAFRKLIVETIADNHNGAQLRMVQVQGAMEEGGFIGALAELEEAIVGADGNGGIKAQARTLLDHAAILNPALGNGLAQLNGCDIVTSTLQKLRGHGGQEPVALGAALVYLDGLVTQKRQAYIDVNNGDIARACLVYQDNAINRRGDSPPVEDRIDRIDHIDALTPIQQDFVRQLFAQTNWAYIMAQQSVVLKHHMMQPNDHLKAISGMVAEIVREEDGIIDEEQVVEGNHYLHMYGAFKVQKDGSIGSTPDVLTEIKIKLTGMEAQGGQHEVNLASKLYPELDEEEDQEAGLQVSVTSCYMNPKYQPRGLEVNERDEDGDELTSEAFLLYIERFFDIQHRHYVNDLDRRVNDGLLSHAHRNEEMLSFFENKLPILRCLYGDEPMTLMSFDFMMNDIKKRHDLVMINNLFGEDGEHDLGDIRSVDINRLHQALVIPKYTVRGEFCRGLGLLLADPEFQADVPNPERPDLLTEVRALTIRVFGPLCANDDHAVQLAMEQKLEANAKQFARKCLYGLGELRFSQNPLQWIMMMVDSFLDWIFGDKMKEVTGEKKSETVKTFVEVILEARRGQGEVQQAI